ncbi:MAG TPA: peptide-methionine (S)-S-oxide reductase [Phycisphaerales bacterium]|nr:peptide-methionine (S)-S-oxide reductase [Phycisphaerales bacterium]
MKSTQAESAEPVGHQASIPAGFSPTEWFKSHPVEASRLRTATFGAGCFWGVESTFQAIEGVTHTAVGYSGGTSANPTYKQVCSDGTGHAEVIELLFDPAVVSYDALLGVFWANHNPTTLNRQGPDIGTQYRSAIFFHDTEQRDAAEKSKAALAESGKWGARPIVTQIAPARPFYLAEEHHQRYLEKRGLTHCHTP